MASHEIRVSGKHRGSEGRRRTKMKCHAGHAYKMLTVCLRDVRTIRTPRCFTAKTCP